ncbi:MAG: cell division protein FtsQ/DivIB [Chitinophagaceae bacterium]
MNAKRTIQKVLIIIVWLVVGSGMTVLLIAANKKEQKHVCKEIKISINSGNKAFVGKEEVLKILQKAAKSTLVNQSITAVNLSHLENVLEKNPWIKSAEIYFDSQDVLHVRVQERVPVARVFTTAYNSFYMDSSGRRMPLLEDLSLRLPVVTNFANAKKFNRKESLLLNEVKKLTQFITADAFWNAQIAQIDITPYRKFELTPTVGNHIIRIGTAEDLEAKFNRLLIFYRQVMSKAGFDKYRVLDVQYEGQVIARHNVPLSAIDSIQLQKNIEALFEEHRQQLIDSIAVAVLQEEIAIRKDSSSVKRRPATTKKKTLVVNPNPNPIKTSLPSKPKENKKKNVGRKKDENKPKAVMPENDY